MSDRADKRAERARQGDEAATARAEADRSHRAELFNYYDKIRLEVDADVNSGVPLALEPRFIAAMRAADATRGDRVAQRIDSELGVAGDRDAYARSAYRLVPPKKLGTAYALLFLTGLLGGHKAYLHKVHLMPVYILTLGGLGIALIYDVVTLRTQVNRANAEIGSGEFAEVALGTSF